MDLTRDLLNWYYLNSRDLPWRRTKDPYLVWLSEIIMQQTRISQGLPYYNRFAAAYPAVADLAGADEQDILKLWQGLGYYSRARNMLETARMIRDRYDGVFPCTYDSIRSLKGVGEYTAAAIASISFGLPCPVVDGNVMRFVARLYGIGEPVDRPATRKKIHALAAGLLDPLHPGDFNQAMMEFGALVCTPANPSCQTCIFRQRCEAFLRGATGSIPSKAAKVRVQHRHIHYLVLTTGEKRNLSVFLEKRTGNDIWKNLYDFPHLEKPPEGKASRPVTERELRMAFPLGRAEFLGVSDLYIHLLTHQKLHIRFYRFHSAGKTGLPGIAVRMKDMDSYPVPKVVERYLAQLQITNYRLK